MASGGTDNSPTLVDSVRDKEIGKTNRMLRNPDGQPVGVFYLR